MVEGGRRALRLIGLALAALCIVLVGLRAGRFEGRFLTLLVSFAPWAAVLGLAALGCLALSRFRTGARWYAWADCVLVLAMVVQSLLWQVPFFSGEAPQRADMRVLLLNTEFGQARPETVKTLVEKTAPDVVVFCEATPEFTQRVSELGAVGPGGLVPYYGEVPADELKGTVTYSKWPLEYRGAADVSDGAFRFKVAAPVPFTLTSLHTAQPLSSYENWKRDMRSLATAARKSKGAHLMVGDFNATNDHAEFREILRQGMRDGAEQANSGWQPTWPVGFLPIRMLSLDHMLTSSRLGVVKTRTYEVEGTDHVALLADIRRSS